MYVKVERYEECGKIEVSKLMRGDVEWIILALYPTSPTRVMTKDGPSEVSESRARVIVCLLNDSQTGLKATLSFLVQL